MSSNRVITFPGMDRLPVTRRGRIRNTASAPHPILPKIERLIRKDPDVVDELETIVDELLGDVQTAPAGGAR